MVPVVEDTGACRSERWALSRTLLVVGVKKMDNSMLPSHSQEER